LAKCLWGLAILIVGCGILCWWKWPHGEQEDEGPGFVVEDSPDAEIEGSVPKQTANKGFELRRSPRAKVNITTSEETGDEDQEPGEP
jgi:hypothetical protein